MLSSYLIWKFKGLCRVFGFLLVTILNLSYCSNECPYFPLQSIIKESYAISNFLRIPQTNIMLTCATDSVLGRSMVYFLDFATGEGNVLHQILPDYLITEIDFATTIKQLIIINYGSLILADPYTLKSIYSISIFQGKHVIMVKQSKYAIVTLQDSTILVFDTELMSFILSMSASSQPNHKGIEQVFSNYFTLTTGTSIILVTNKHGVFMWTVDIEDKTYQYKGYIPNLLTSSGDSHFEFQKVPNISRDIFVFTNFNSRNIFIEIKGSPEITFSDWGTIYAQNNTQSVEQYYTMIVSQGDYHILLTKGRESTDESYIYWMKIGWTDSTVVLQEFDRMWMRAYKRWYYDEVSEQLISPSRLIRIFNFAKKEISYKFYYLFDGLSPQFAYQENGYDLKFAFVYNQLEAFQDQQQLSDPSRSFSINIRWWPKSSYRVQNCYDCIIFKGEAEYTTPPFLIVSFRIFPFNTDQKDFYLDDLNLSWDQVSLQIDPFYYEDNVWVVLGFPRLYTPIDDHLFVLINVDTGTSEQLRVTDPELEHLNSNISSFALVSLDDTTNQEIVGIDNVGNVYFWDLKTREYKTYITLPKCLESEIGGLVHYLAYKWVVVICGNTFDVVVYDVARGSTTVLQRVLAYPYFIRTFSDPGMIVVGDYLNGNVYIYKLNTSTLTFSLHQEIIPGQISDSIIYVELLKNDILWIQYHDSEVFYHYKPCFDDISLCQSCEMTTYFRVSNENLGISRGFGSGTELDPYTTSESILLPLAKAQILIDRLVGLNEITVNIIVDSDYEMDLIQRYLQSASNPSINLVITSNQLEKKLQLSCTETVKFTNYNSVRLMNVDLTFKLPSSYSSCGIELTSISKSVSFDKLRIELSESSTQTVNCNRIISTNSNLTISDYVVSNSFFDEGTSIITMNSENQLQLSGLNISNCTFSDSSTIVTGSEDTTLIVDTMQIDSNMCSPTKNLTSLPMPLFSAGALQVSNTNILGNSFCKKHFFHIYPSIAHNNHKFLFTDITINSNTIQSQTPYVFFNAIYNMLISPSHALILSNIVFNSNTLAHISNSDRNIASMFATQNIDLISFTNVTLVNHHEISLASIYKSTTTLFNHLNCSNDQSFFENNITVYSNSCLEFSETQSSSFTALTIKYKRIADKSLLSFENKKLTTNEIFSLIESSISNNQLTQTQMNQIASPLRISSKKAITITIDSCTFASNTLNGLQSSLLYSTTGIWTKISRGSIAISNSHFKKSVSNSKHSFLRINSNSATISHSEFSDSTSSDSSTNIDGGMIFLQASTISIFTCNFNQAFARKGGFLYISPSESKNLKVNIQDSNFSEGFALLKGSAIYFDLASSTLSFTCNNCFFKDIVQMSTLASSIEVDTLLTGNNSEQNGHQIQLTSGSIENIFGVLDNFFLSTTYSVVTLTSIVCSSTENIISSFTGFNYYSTTFPSTSLKQQQASLIQATGSSIIQLTECTVNDFVKYQPTTTTTIIPSLIYATTLTNVFLSKVTVTNSKFTHTAIKVTSGKLFIKDTSFKNVTQITSTQTSESSSTSSLSSQRLLAEVPTEFNEQFPSSQTIASSLIILDSSILNISDNTKFEEITCTSDTCYGSTLQLLSSSFIIQNTQISSSNATFGGAIFVNGIASDSSIISSIFSDNNSTRGGGAIYLKTLSSDSFMLSISDSEFTGNRAISGKGGAIYASSPSSFNATQSINLSSSKISNNIALVAGGLFYSKILLSSSHVTMSNNQGLLSGSDYMTLPSHLIFENQSAFLESTANAVIDSSTKTIQVNNFRSGDSLKGLTFTMRTDDEIEVTPLNVSEEQTYRVSVNVSNKTQENYKYTLTGELNVKYSAGIGYSFSNFVVVGVPGKQAILSFSSSQIYVLDLGKKTLTQDYTYEIFVNFRECISGERINQYGNYTECTTCKEGQYSLDFQKCYNCPTGATCAGGNSIVPKARYWQKEPHTDEIILCDNLEENCQGGTYGNSSCYEGHIGALCEECDIFGNNSGASYSRSGKYSCVRCDLIKNNTWIVALVTIWTLISMSLAIKGTIDTIESKAAELIIKKHVQRRATAQPQKQLFYRSQITNSKGISSKTQIMQSSRTLFSSQHLKKQQTKQIQSAPSLNDGSKSGIYIKILTNYLQIIGSIATFNLSIPTGVIEFPETVRQPLQSTLNSLDCVLKDIHTQMPIIYVRLLFSLTIPLIYFIIFIGILIAYFKVAKKKKEFPIFMVSTAGMFLFLYVQTDLVGQGIALLSCRVIGNTSYILQNVSYECYTDDYYNYGLGIVLPLLLFLVFFIPAFIFSKLHNQRNNLDDLQVKLNYGFLYKEYTNREYYWEFVKMCQRLLIILSLNFFSQDIVLKGLIVFIVITGYGISSMKFTPYQDEDINQMDALSTQICAISVLLGVFIYKNEFQYFVYLAFVIISLINLAFFLYILKKIIQEFIIKIDLIIQQFIDTLIHKLPWLKILKKKQPPKSNLNPNLKLKLRGMLRKFLDLKPVDKKKLVTQIITDAIFQKNTFFFEEEENEIEQQQQQIEETSQVSQRSVQQDKMIYQSQQNECHAHEPLQANRIYTNSEVGGEEEKAFQTEQLPEYSEIESNNLEKDKKEN